MKSAEIISRILQEIERFGFSIKKPVCIGHNEKRLSLYASENGINIASGGLYTSPKALAHMTRQIKIKNGIIVPSSKISAFPSMRQKFDLFYDKYAGIFIYVDTEKNKYVIHPSYQLTLGKRKKQVVFFLTASKLKSLENFYNDTRRYIIKKRRGD